MASKFGGLLGGGSGKSDKDNSLNGQENPPVARPISGQLPREGSRRLPRLSRRATPTFAVLLDATASMQPSIDHARYQIKEILERGRIELGSPIKVQFYCYRDYDVTASGRSLLLERSPMTEDAEVLSAWLANIEADGGGMNSGEATEVALEAVHELITTHGERIAAVLLAGDEPSNSRANLEKARRHQHSTAREWASRLGERQIPVHTFVVGNRADTTTDFEEIARLSGGKTGHLDGSASMLNMAALAMVAAAGGVGAVRNYEKRHLLTGPEKAFARLLIAGPKS